MKDDAANLKTSAGANSADDAHAASKARSALLDVRGLSIEMRSSEGWRRVVSDVDLSMNPGESHALVGESGSGKSVTALSLLRLFSHRQARFSGGTATFDGVDLVNAGEQTMRQLRGRRVSMIFQEPMSSLNPSMPVGRQIAESLVLHRGMTWRKAHEAAVEYLAMVGIREPRMRARDYPHVFSGGMRQRVMIAIAVACEPDLLIADEPTTALDVTVQASILQLLKRLQDDMGMAILLVSHDLAVVADFCDRGSVMYAGQIVVNGDMPRLFQQPTHPYVAGLYAAVPGPHRLGQPLVGIPGVVPTPGHMPDGCRFAPRCRLAVEGLCDATVPELVAVGDEEATRCVRYQNADVDVERIAREYAA